ncbi:hypothetical protein DAQ1742_02542 [Dickeya aquatica]|uniref:Uncharacterized protein n=1 Tax=Dickeya aquatica TaxID=1401087 RepID=A0A375ABJ0_9GAMM|nr:hypothetical protein DAQ1742_02542 [Dickeya aquatica]
MYAAISSVLCPCCGYAVPSRLVLGCPHRQVLAPYQPFLLTLTG